MAESEDDDAVESAAGSADGENDKPGEKVVSLDAFRKKP